jgi:hypothetical protein
VSALLAPDRAGARLAPVAFGSVWHREENQASEQGQFGGIVNGSVCAAFMERL